VASVKANGADADMHQIDWYPLRIEEAFTAVSEQLGADELSVTFDPVLGYPTSVNANPVLDMHDDEFSFEITDFVAGP
jgi:hypothetical protein